MAVVERWLVHMKRGNFKAPDDQVSVQHHEQAATELVGTIITGALEKAELAAVFKINVTQGTITEYVPKLDNWKLVLVPKVVERPDPFEVIHPGARS